MQLEVPTTLSVLRDHGIDVARIGDTDNGDETIASVNAVDVAIECSDDLMLGRTIELRSAGRRVDRLSPVDVSQALAMAGELYAALGATDRDESVRHLAGLIVRAESVFAIAGVERVVLDPVRAYDGGYGVVDATIEARRSLPFRRRAMRHVRDGRTSRRADVPTM